MAIDYSALYPVLIMVVFAAALPAVHLVAKSSRAVAGVSVVGIIASMGLVVYYMVNGYPATMGGENTPLFQLDVFASLFRAGVPVRRPLMSSWPRPGTWRRTATRRSTSP